MIPFCAVIVALLALSGCNAEIDNLNVKNDDRQAFSIATFGFVASGQATISIKNYAVQLSITFAIRVVYVLQLFGGSIPVHAGFVLHKVRCVANKLGVSHRRQVSSDAAVQAIIDVRQHPCSI